VTSPLQTLLDRLRLELAADFSADKPMNTGVAQGTLDVMGGISEDAGSLTLTAPLQCGAAVATQLRDDRQIQVFSFNRYDQHLSFTFRIPLDALIGASVDKLREDLNEPGRKWALPIVAGVFALYSAGSIDGSNPSHRGLNVATFSTVPSNSGAGATAAMNQAMMMARFEGFRFRKSADHTEIAVLAGSRQMDLLAMNHRQSPRIGSFAGGAGSLVRLRCNPHELQPLLKIPDGVRVFGINSNVTSPDRSSRAMRLHIATEMARQMILDAMRQIGKAAGKTLVGDPMSGYLANLDPEDYKRLFRPTLPEFINGKDFLDRFAKDAGDLAIDPNEKYAVQHAADHHILEARRVRRFCEFLEAADSSTDTKRQLQLDSAGHLMYASHLSYSNDAMLGHENCDLLVKLIRDRRQDGILGARITRAGCGGIVAVLAEESERVDEATEEILLAYKQRTGIEASVLKTSASSNQESQIQ
jgi:galactokinase